MTASDDVYEYRTLRVEAGAWPKIAATVGSEPWAPPSSGFRLFGLWTGQGGIGAANDEGVLVTLAGSGAGDDPAAAVPRLISAESVTVTPTLRPTDPTPPTENGVYAHRWFTVATSDLGEFVELSGAAWPSFEAAYPGIRIVGLWRAGTAAGDSGDSEETRLLLVSRYPRLDTWEQSRTYAPTPPEGVDPALYEVARRSFRRRNELTRWSIVRTYRLLAPRVTEARSGPGAPEPEPVSRPAEG